MLTNSKILSLTLLIVSTSANAKCLTDTDCGILYECQDSVCLHKSLTPIHPTEYLASVIVFLMSALTNSTGFGGGEIMVPLLILLFFFNTHLAVPLSLVIMLGSSFIRTILCLPERHQKLDRPIIDYCLVAFILPPLLAGSTLGFFLNRVLPGWTILSLMTCLLFYLTVHIAKRARRSFYQARKIQTWEYVQDTLPNEGTSVIKPAVQPEIFPLKPIIAISSVFIFSLMVVFIRGDTHKESIFGIAFNSEKFWVIVVIKALVLFFVSLYGLFALCKRSQRLIDQNYCFMHDVRWNVKKSTFVMVMAVIAGLGIGILGIGGSAIINPAMVYVGVHHDVTRATVRAAVFLTCSITLIQYIHAGMVMNSYALWFFGISLLGAGAGTSMIVHSVRKFDKRYLPLIILAVVLAVTTVVTPTFVIANVTKGVMNENWQNSVYQMF